MIRLRILLVAVAVSMLGFGAAQAQSQAETLEDVRQEISQLSEVMQNLRSELLATGNSGVSQDSVGTILQRLNILEGELSAALGRVETLQFRIIQIADDGARRIGDLEFRITELEGGDTSVLGDPVPLGGATNTTEGSELASNEQRSFNEAVSQFNDANYDVAVALFDAFISTYPGGPLTSEAQFQKGHALAGLQDWQNAARSYLDAFSGAPDGPLAADALFELSVSLGTMGQAEQACLTLDQIVQRYPEREAEMAEKIFAQQQALACQ